MAPPNKCPFDETSLISPPEWITGGQSESASPAYIRQDSIYFRHATPAVFLPIEFDLRRLEVVGKYLWLAGRPMPARPLHAQLSFKRNIMLTEQLDMHLLWRGQRMFLKPLPRYLLQSSFWRDHLLCGSTCSCPSQDKAPANPTCTTARLRSIALGFLLSWVSLIQYESDLRIAQEAHLLPSDLGWSFWHSLVQQVMSLQDHPGIHSRWVFGELRLHRIDLMYRFAPGVPGGSLMRGYRTGFREYRAYVQFAFAYFIGAFAVVTIILNAFQVGLGTNRYGSDASFQNASGGFAVFSIFSVLVSLVLLTVGMCASLFFNFDATLKFRAKRRDTLKSEVI